MAHINVFERFYINGGWVFSWMFALALVILGITFGSDLFILSGIGFTIILAYYEFFVRKASDD